MENAHGFMRFIRTQRTAGQVKGDREEQNTDVCEWLSEYMRVNTWDFSQVEPHPESSHENTAGDSEKQTKESEGICVKPEENLNYVPN